MHDDLDPDDLELPPPEISEPATTPAAPAARTEEPVCVADDTPRADNTPKADDNTERAVLASILLGAPVPDGLVSSHFRRHRHQLIYEAIASVHADRAPIDLVTVRRALGDRLLMVGGPAYLGELLDGSYKSSHVEYYAGLLMQQDVGSRALPEVLTPGAHMDDANNYLEIGQHEFADQVLRAIPPGVLYRRGDIAGEIVGPQGDRHFRMLTNSRLRVLVDQHVRLVRWQKKRTDPDPVKVYVNCSRDHGSILLDAAGIHPTVRNLRLLVPYPCFLESFELARGGWNSGGVYYDEPPGLEDLPAITDERAHEVLQQLTEDFPFKDQASRQNFYGLLLSPILRPALGGNVPMHLLLSPLERTGKTKLAEQVLGGIILGRPTPAMQLTGNDEERDKRILALLLRGDTVVHLDNVREYLDSAALSSLITSSYYSGRPLGESKIVELPNHTTIVASGNNVRATGELVKRTVPIQLQPETDHPEDRADFKHPDLPAHVVALRRDVLGSLIGMVVRWRDNGRKSHLVLKGGFERWSQVVGGILNANLFLKWRSNEREWSRQADPHGEDLRAFVEAWATKYPDESLTAAQLVALAEEIGVFQYELKATTERGRQTAFSMSVLRKHSDTPVGDWIIRAEGGAPRKTYRLEAPQ
jgi:hypothetical protein